MDRASLGFGIFIFGMFALAVILVINLGISQYHLDNESNCTGDLGRLDSESMTRCSDELEDRLDALNRFVEQPFSTSDDLNSTDTSCRRCN